MLRQSCCRASGIALFAGCVGFLLVGCGGTAIDELPDEEGRLGGRSNRSAADERSSFDEQLGSVSDGQCNANWESIGLNDLAQRRQWSAPGLSVDCGRGTQSLSTVSVQKGFRLQLTFVFSDGEFVSAVQTTTVTADIEVESEFLVDFIRFEDRNEGRRHIEFEGRIIPPQGNAIAAKGVGDACQMAVSC